MANRYQTMQRNAEKIADNDSAMKKKNAKCWKVASQSHSGKWYKVTITESGMKCTCICNQKRGVCKHAKAIELAMLRDAKGNVKSEPVKLNDVKPHCPRCTESRIVKDGHRNCKRRARHKDIDVQNAANASLVNLDSQAGTTPQNQYYFH